jgi:EAL domain-containing protein (putative c-di-GMP-specific phosphodiesterase class I)/DNA-binding NarL/FixJ family response regulator
MAGVPVRVLIADDQQFSAAVSAATLGSAPEFELVGVAESAAEVEELARRTAPDVALISTQLPGGAENAVRAIMDAAPDARALAHSGLADHVIVMAMLRAGASGYVPRDATVQRLVPSLRRAVVGDVVLDDVSGGDVLNGLVAQVHDANRLHEWRLAQRARIRRVMDRGHLEVVFQPIVELATRRTVGYEALSRFPGHPERGPQEWFADAHEVGLGTDLELHAIRLACERSRALPDGAFMAVNVSPATTERPELLELLDSADVDHVVLEVTEHEPVEDYRRFRVALARVREHGAQLAVDDAGAGFASLRHVLELDADIIKLDGSLTRSLEDDPRRRSLAAAIIEFGRESGAFVLAEHIESELQLSELRRLGVAYGQGYHLGPPAPLPAALALASGDDGERDRGRASGRWRRSPDAERSGAA